MQSKSIFKTIIIHIGLAISSLAINSNSANAQKKNISLEDIWKNKTFNVKGVPGFNVLNDGKRFVKVENEGDLNIYNLSNNTALGTLINASDLLYNDTKIKLNNFVFSSDEKKVLIFDAPKSIYRHSTLYNVYVLDLFTKKMEAIDDEKVLHASFSPNGNYVAYVKNNNIYIKDLIHHTVKQITFDGMQNSIINGNCDWVYEEEFSFTQAYQWSPKGNYIAYYKFDESKVKNFTMFYDNGETYPEAYTYKYPKAGEDNSKVSIHIYNLSNEATVKADIGENEDQYIPRIKWTNSDKTLSISRLNRHQNRLEILFTNADKGNSDIKYEENNDRYIDITDNLAFMPDNESFIISSEKDGYNHLYQWNWKKKIAIPLTKGTNEIKDVLAIDTKEGKIYYTLIENVLNTAFYVLDIKSKQTKKLSNKPGTYDISICNGLQYFVSKYASTTQVPVYNLVDKTGKIVRILEDNKTLAQTLIQYNISPISFFKVPIENNIELNAYMIKPTNFDINKKYPVLMYQYSGPGSQRVLNNFQLDNYWWHQYLAEKGYIIVIADGRGTGGRGEDFKKMTYLELGKYESDDQIKVAEYLQTLNYVDASRIGIWGWSYGGFMSTTCILKAPNLFKAAIAVAPVTNWRSYDNIYTERFMRTPQENPKGYEDNAPLSMAKNLKGKYLLIHGIADDNVHIQNATELSKVLVNENKPFEQFYYTNKNHGISGGNARLHLYTMMTKFILENL